MRNLMLIICLMAVISCKKNEPDKVAPAPTSTNVRLYVNAGAYPLTDISFTVNSGNLFRPYPKDSCYSIIYDTTFTMDYGDTLKWGAGTCGCGSCTVGQVMWDGKESRSNEVVIK